MTKSLRSRPAHSAHEAMRPGPSRVAENFTELFSDDSFETAFPEEMEQNADWADLNEAGFDHIDVARMAFPEIAEAHDDDVEEFLFELTENMSPAELESFWSGLANFGKKALRVAAPVVQAAAPIVGTAVGAAFGGVGAPIGGAIGSLLGTGAGALNQAVNGPGGGGQRRTRRAPSRGRGQTRRRGSRRTRRGRRSGATQRNLSGAASQIGGAVSQIGGAAGRQVMQLLQDPQIQSALLNMAQRGVGAIVGAGGESISETAAIAGLIEGMRQVLQEAQDHGHDLDNFDGDFAPGDFESAHDAFETLVDILGAR